MRQVKVTLSARGPCSPSAPRRRGGPFPSPSPPVYPTAPRVSSRRHRARPKVAVCTLPSPFLFFRTEIVQVYLEGNHWKYNLGKSNRKLVYPSKIGGRSLARTGPVPRLKYYGLPKNGYHHRRNKKNFTLYLSTLDLSILPCVSKHYFGGYFDFILSP